MGKRRKRDGIVRRIELRRLYLQEVPSEVRTAGKLMVFQWLIEADRSNLISTDAGDAYQLLKVELKASIRLPEIVLPISCPD
jgi:hypothetical protein